MAQQCETRSCSREKEEAGRQSHAAIWMHHFWLQVNDLLKAPPFVQSCLEPLRSFDCVETTLVFADSTHASDKRKKSQYGHLDYNTTCCQRGFQTRVHDAMLFLLLRLVVHVEFALKVALVQVQGSTGNDWPRGASAGDGSSELGRFREATITSSPCVCLNVMWNPVYPEGL